MTTSQHHKTALMKRFYSLLLCLIFVYSSINAQKPPIQLSWLNTAPSYLNGGSFSAQGVTNLSDGSIAVVGYFQHTVDFDPGPDTFNLTTTAYYGIFVAKYTNQGKLAFAYGFSESNISFFDENYESANAVTTDANDNIYVTGTFRGAVDFDPDSGKTILSTGSSSSNNFIACYTKNGKLKFAKDITSGHLGYYTTSLSIAVDKNKNLYVTGNFDGTSVDFNPGPDSTNITSVNGGEDIFFAKYDSVGNYVFAKKIGGYSYDQVSKITVDSKKNILICGDFYSGSVDFDPGTPKHILKRVSTNADLFFAKYDSNGNYIFAKNVGNYKANVANSIAVGKDDGFVLTGYFYGTQVDFDIDNPGTHLLTSNGAYDIFIAKYDYNGNCNFAFNIGNKSGDIGSDIGLDSNENIICTGTYGGSNVDFDPGKKVYKLASTLPNNYYVAKYSYNGYFISAISLNGGIYADNFRINCLHVTPANKILIGGFYTDSFDVDAGPDSTILTSPAATMFVVKYDDNENYLGVIHGDNYHDYAFPYSKVSSSAIDKKGNVYVCGIFDGQYDFDPGKNKNILASSADIYGTDDQNSFFAKYDKNGNLIFAKAITSGNNHANDIAVDNEGNIYLTGVSDGFTDFDPDSHTYYLETSDSSIHSSYNYFLAKYDNNGNLIYAKGDVADYYLNVASLALDNKSNICIAGLFNGLTDFDPGPNKHILNGGDGLGNMFIAKYDSAGNYLFAYSVQSSDSRGRINDLKFDDKNNIVFTGTFNGTNLDFDAGPSKFLLSSSFSGDVDAGFITIYKNNGAFISAIKIDGQDYSYSNFSHLTTDNSGNIYIAGSSTNFADFDPGPGTAFLSQPHEIFFASYNSKLQFLFLKGIEGSGDYKEENDLNAITTDKNKNIYVAGEFATNNIDCDPGINKLILANSFKNGYNYNLFIAKYDSLGNYIYSNRFQTDSATGYNSFASVFIHDDGTIYYSGTATGKINFATGNKKVYLQPTTNGGNIFIAKYQQTTTLSQISNSITQSKNIATSHIKFYPNPITNHVNIELDNIEQNNATALIGLYDIKGRLLYTKSASFTNHRLHTTLLIPVNIIHGSYFIKVAVGVGKLYYSDILIKQ